MTVQLSSLVNPVATSGTPVVIKDEGIQQTSGATSIDFVGVGVTAVASGGAATITIPGGVTAHSGLSGLGADDHTQYHTDVRGDLRYVVQNGYEDRTQSTLSFVGATRVFTHNPSGTCYVWSNGIRYVKSSPETVTIANTEGLHFIYFDSSGVLQETTTFLPSIITTYAYVAGVYYDATNAVGILVMEERHGREMDSMTHLYLHNTAGSRWGSGLDLNNVTADGSGDLAIHAQVGINAGSIWDEDLKHTIGALTIPAAAPFLYRLGAAGDWRKLASTGYVVSPTGTGRAAWNRNNAGTWSLQEAASNNFVLMHLIATGEITTPLLWVVGQDEYTTLAYARAGADVEWASLNMGGFSSLLQEFVVCATVIIHTATAYANAVKSRIRTLADGSLYVDWRKSGASAAGGASGASVIAYDEGVSLTSTLNSLNFVGGGVTATGLGSAVTVTIPSTSLGSIDGGAAATTFSAYSLRMDFGAAT